MVEMDEVRIRQLSLILNDGGEIPIDYKGKQYLIRIVSGVPRVVYNGSIVPESTENYVHWKHFDCSTKQFIDTYVAVKNHSNKITKINEKAKRDALKRKRKVINERRKILNNEILSEFVISKEKIPGENYITLSNISIEKIVPYIEKNKSLRRKYGPLGTDITSEVKSDLEFIKLFKGLKKVKIID
jgi:hypothetical protein